MMRNITDYKVAIGHSKEVVDEDIKKLKAKGYEELESIYAGSFGQSFPKNDGFKGIQMVPMVMWSESSAVDE